MLINSNPVGGWTNPPEKDAQVKMETFLPKVRDEH